jgi:hypothetical protein
MDLSHTLKKLYLPQAKLEYHNMKRREGGRESNSIVMVVVGYG